MNEDELTKQARIEETRREIERVFGRCPVCGTMFVLQSGFNGCCSKECARILFASQH